MQRLRTRRPESKGALDDNVQHLQQLKLRCYQSPEPVRSISDNVTVPIILDSTQVFFGDTSTNERSRGLGMAVLEIYLYLSILRPPSGCH